MTASAPRGESGRQPRARNHRRGLADRLPNHFRATGCRHRRGMPGRRQEARRGGGRRRVSAGRAKARRAPPSRAGRTGRAHALHEHAAREIARLLHSLSTGYSTERPWARPPPARCRASRRRSGRAATPPRPPLAPWALWPLDAKADQRPASGVEAIDATRRHTAARAACGPRCLERPTRQLLARRRGGGGVWPRLRTPMLPRPPPARGKAQPVAGRLPLPSRCSARPPRDPCVPRARRAARPSVKARNVSNMGDQHMARWRPAEDLQLPRLGHGDLATPAWASAGSAARRSVGKRRMGAPPTVEAAHPAPRRRRPGSSAWPADSQARARATPLSHCSARKGTPSNCAMTWATPSMPASVGSPARAMLTIQRSAHRRWQRRGRRLAGRARIDCCASGQAQRRRQRSSPKRTGTPLGGQPFQRLGRKRPPTPRVHAASSLSKGPWVPEASRKSVEGGDLTPPRWAQRGATMPSTALRARPSSSGSPPRPTRR